MEIGCQPIAPVMYETFRLSGAIPWGHCYHPTRNAPPPAPTTYHTIYEFPKIAQTPWTKKFITSITINFHG